MHRTEHIGGGGGTGSEDGSTDMMQGLTSWRLGVADVVVAAVVVDLKQNTSGQPFYGGSDAQ